ncbi:MAG: ankyrin repeat domain-containing protein, partial [Magnetococcales bacterium]|nr:ankyrin repeat domain-containing protein [Magnetococcales bacterium]
MKDNMVSGVALAFSPIAMIDRSSPTKPIPPVTNELVTAIIRGDLDTVDTLLKNGKSLTAVGQTRNTPLMWAAEYNQVAVVNRLLEANAEINAKNRWGNTALHLAVQWGYEQLALLLLSAGADVNAINNQGRDALMVAARHDHRNMARMLLDRDADLHRADTVMDETALMIAAKWGSGGIVD